MLHQQSCVLLWRDLDVFQESGLRFVPRDVHDADRGEAGLVQVRGKRPSPRMGADELPLLIFGGNLLSTFRYGLQDIISNTRKLAYIFDVVIELLVADGERDAAVPVPYFTNTGWMGIVT